MLKITGILAITIYFMMVGLLFYYFNHHSDKKNIHFVKKNSDRIMVSLPASKGSSSSKSKQEKRVTRDRHKKIEKKREKKKKIIKKKKVKKKKVKKKKIVKKKSIVKKNRTKKRVDKKRKREKVSSLFDKVNDKKPKGSNSQKNSQKKQDKGIENVYFANVEDILQGWNAQSEFAGESAKIWVKIQRDGSFKFKLTKPSNNLEFNRGLIEYLRQLQKIGFDPHNNSKAYELNIEFIAKE